MGGFVRTVAQKITEDEQQSLAQSRFARGNSDEPIAQFADHPTEVNPLRAAWEAFNPGKTFGVDQGVDYTPQLQVGPPPLQFNQPSPADEYQQAQNFILQNPLFQQAQRYRQMGQEAELQDRAMQLGITPQNPAAPPSPDLLDPSQQAQVRAFGRLLTPTEEMELGYRTPQHQALIGALSNPIGYGAGLAAQGITAAVSPITGPIDRALPEQLQGPAETAGHFAAGAVPYAALGPLGPLGGVVGAQQAALGVAEPLGQYSAGLISGKEALTQAGINAATVLAPLVAHLGIEALKSPQAEAILAKFGPQERAAIIARLQSERGGGMFGEKPPEAGAGGEPSPAGDLLPSPPESAAAPTSAADILPPENQKLMGLMQQVTISDQDRALLKNAAANQRAGRITQILNQEGNPEDLLRQAGAARAGKILPEAQSIAEHLAPEDITSYRQQIVDAARTGNITAFEAPKASEALNILLNGDRQLQPAEMTLLGRVFGKAFEEAIPRSPSQLNIWRELMDAANVPRSLAASADLSGTLRQGAILTVSHPVEAAKAFVSQIKSFFSQKSFDQAMEDLRANDRFGLAQEAGLDLADPLRGPTGREESFMSGLAERIPVVGKLVRASERGYVAYLNKLRLDVFKTVVDGWESGKVPLTTKNTGELANFLNNATGRGKLGGALTPNIQTLNALFFAPRLVASRVQLLADLVRPNQDPAVRMLVARDLAAFTGTGMAVLSLLKLSGANVGLDPRSSNFGKVQMGGATLDFWAGEQQIARYTAQLITGQKSLEAGGYKSVSDADRWHTVGRFLRSKFAPVPSMITDFYTGTDFTGQNATLSNEAIRNFTPLFLQDLAQAVQEHNATAAGLSTLGGLGVGVQTGGLRDSTMASVKKDALQEQLSNTKINGIKYGDIPDKAWADTAKRFNLSGSDSFKQFLDDDFARYQKAHPGDPAVQKAKYEALPGVKRARAYYNQQVNRYQAPFERNQETRKLLLQAGILKPTKPADQKLLEDTAQ